MLTGVKRYSRHVSLFALPLNARNLELPPADVLACCVEPPSERPEPRLSFTVTLVGLPLAARPVPVPKLLSVSTHRARRNHPGTSITNRD